MQKVLLLWNVEKCDGEKKGGHDLEERAVDGL
jgi:hypothetical protein